MPGARTSARHALAVAATAATAIAAVAMMGTAAQAQSPCGPSYVMQPGDTLFRVTQQCGVSLQALLDANPAIEDINDIAVGTAIAIPGGPGAAPQPPADAAPPPAADAQTHTVGPGESLSAIARQFGVTVEDLMAANPGLDPGGLQIGITIRLPGFGGIWPPPFDPGTVTVEGRVSSGAECPIITTPDGTVYSLTGIEGQVRPGDYARVTGQSVDVSFCMQGVATLEVLDATPIPAG